MLTHRSCCRALWTVCGVGECSGAAGHNQRWLPSTVCTCASSSAARVLMLMWAGVSAAAQLLLFSVLNTLVCSPLGYCRHSTRQNIHGFANVLSPCMHVVAASQQPWLLHSDTVERACPGCFQLPVSAHMRGACPHMWCCCHRTHAGHSASLRIRTHVHATAAKLSDRSERHTCIHMDALLPTTADALVSHFHGPVAPGPGAATDLQVQAAAGQPCSTTTS
jgi:hypothetical protein